MREAVTRTAGQLGLSALLDRRPDRLSGGQLRRLAIGCAVITGPQVVLMDEPFASLDAAGAAGLADFVRTLTNAGTAVVVLGQAIEPPLLDADSWLILDHGTVIAKGTPAELTSGPALPAGIRRAAGLEGAAGVAAETPEARAGHQVPMEQSPLLRCLPPLAFRSSHSRDPVRARPAADGRHLWVDAPASAARATAGVGAAAGAGHQRTRRLQDRQQQYRLSRQPRKQPWRKPLGRPVLQDVFLEVHPGEIVAITGAQRRREIDLLRMFNGLLRPVSGKVLVNGADIAGVPVGRTASRGLAVPAPARPAVRTDLAARGPVRPGPSGPPGPLQAPDRLSRHDDGGRLQLATGPWLPWPRWAWRIQQGSTRPNCRPPTSGSWPWPPSWPAGPPSWRWTSPPSRWTAAGWRCWTPRCGRLRRRVPPSCWSPTTWCTHGRRRTAFCAGGRPPGAGLNRHTNLAGIGNPAGTRRHRNPARIRRPRPPRRWTPHRPAGTACR